MKRYDLELTATGPVMEERQEGAFVPFSEVSGLAEQLADATRQCGVMAELLRELREGAEIHLHNCKVCKNEDGVNNWTGKLARIDSALAGKIAHPAVTVTETIRTAPERIWLQVGDQVGDGDHQFPEHHDEVTWCADSVVACEVPYVRADLAGKVPEQHKTNWPDKCPITRRDFFMEIDGVPTYGGPYDSYTIPEMLGTPEQPWHERELFVRRFDHDEGRWVDDEVISQRVIHDGVLDELLDLKEQQADQSGVAPQGGEPCATEPPSSSPA
ncbi:hypothetical protein [Aeromonas allosaccharophila]|uniref:hypothetical protein n=1 Tax=Aeromonas allosaccharophila TaxID=656 RepID=UPI002ADF0C9A|nr:hypothetical protein [Aeromonas allosaccharophila]